MIGAKAVRTAVAAVCLLTSCAAPVSAGPIPGTAGCRQEKSTFVEVVPDAKGYPNPEAAADALVATLGSRPRTGTGNPRKTARRRPRPGWWRRRTSLRCPDARTGPGSAVPCRSASSLPDLLHPARQRRQRLTFVLLAFHVGQLDALDPRSRS
ncbi:MAG: hypothetical protein HZY73_04105 [Micropruina sp.]|nr:MAG: hypothetical protein HZY73_04105 [Micropruina sp.]